ncbi:transposase [Coraliomargarita algicola]|uniref:Transposase n=1 Tax=Coraliomargarita algicola TaxID=3092156 RepID=A0ABZ0REP1_9BACT|nr:transposase [Coraliomargarita sp. J2-16]WPJ93963.1 transposase [Coraliomargarita sp. J2-16]
MRTKRILSASDGIYHCMSRTVNGAALFKEREMEMFRKMLHRVADFSGVEVLTYCMMNNHFHVLVRVPEASSVSDTELIRRYRMLYPKPTVYQAASAERIAQELKSNGPDAATIRAQLLARMGDISAFMKTLKQRFSTWFNKTHQRFGPLWSDRFKSVLVEGKGNALQTMAAYIDLNPVRAGLVNDPKDYRFCGYAEAVSGQKKAVAALKFITAGLYECSDTDALQSYRCMLFGKGGAPKAGTSQFNRAQAIHVLEEEAGKLPPHILLRCRIRYFSEGAVLGSREFINSHLEKWQHSTRQKHRSKPRQIQSQASEPLVALKGLRGPGYL